MTPIGEELATELGQMGPEVLPRLVREYLELRERDNETGARRKKLTDLLRDQLDIAGGSYIDEVAGVRVYLDETPRWDYDPTLLHEAVRAKIRSEEFAECLETTVKKDVVQGWLDKGLVRPADVAAARVMSRLVRSVKVEQIGRRNAR